MESTSLKQNAEKQKIANKFFEAIYHQTNPEQAAGIVEEIVSEGFVDHNPQFGNTPDKEGFLKTVKTLTSAFEQIYEVIELFQEDCTYTAVWKVKGKHVGSFGGIPATGKEVHAGGITIYQIEDNKIAAHWEYFDAMGIMMQLQS